MTVTIHLVRHGQTLFNVRDVVQGWVDSPLTDLGWAQADAVAAHLADRPLDAIYSSVSERAWDTALRIAAYHPGLDIRLRKGLKEMHFGELEALPNADLFAFLGDPGRYFEEARDGRADALPGGEHPAEFAARIRAALDEIVAAHPTGEVAVVSHGGTIVTLLAMLGRVASDVLVRGVENGSVSTLRVHPEDGWTVDSVGVWQFPPR